MDQVLIVLDSLPVVIKPFGGVVMHGSTLYAGRYSTHDMIQALSSIGQRSLPHVRQSVSYWSWFNAMFLRQFLRQFDHLGGVGILILLAEVLHDLFTAVNTLNDGVEPATNLGALFI